jgi:hypothetical protein
MKPYIEIIVHEGDQFGPVYRKEEVTNFADAEGVLGSAARPAERFFMGIKPGDTPKTNPASKIALEWLDTFVEQTTPAN